MDGYNFKKKCYKIYESRQDSPARFLRLFAILQKKIKIGKPVIKDFNKVHPLSHHLLSDWCVGSKN